MSKIRKGVLLGVLMIATITSGSNVGLTENTLKALSVHTNSPVELLLTDPLGRKSGFNPITNALFEDIPTSAYNTSQSCDEQGSGGCSPPFKSLDVDFAVEVGMSDAAGSWISHFYSGTTAPGRISRFTFPGKVITFAAFGVTLNINSASKAFEVNGTFTLGTDGTITLATQPVSFELRDLLLTIPAGSFSQTRPGTYAFAGDIVGVQLAAELTLTDVRSYTFHIRGAGVPEPPALPSANPVDVRLAIGNNGVDTSVNATFVP